MEIGLALAVLYTAVWWGAYITLQRTPAWTHQTSTVAETLALSLLTRWRRLTRFATQDAEDQAADLVTGMVLLYAATGASVAGFAGFVLASPLSLIPFAMVGAVCGAALRLIENRRVAQTRLTSISHDLAWTVSLMELAVRSGAPLVAAVESVAKAGDDFGHTPLAAELSRFAQRVRDGHLVEDALAELSARAPLPEVQSLVRTLSSNYRVGAGLEHALSEQVQSLRAMEQRNAEATAKAIEDALVMPTVLTMAAAMAAAFAPFLAAIFTAGGQL